MHILCAFDHPTSNTTTFKKKKKVIENASHIGNLHYFTIDTLYSRCAVYSVYTSFVCLYLCMYTVFLFLSYFIFTLILFHINLFLQLKYVISAALASSNGFAKMSVFIHVFRTLLLTVIK